MHKATSRRIYIKKQWPFFYQGTDKMDPFGTANLDEQQYCILIPSGFMSPCSSNIDGHKEDHPSRQTIIL